VEGSESHVIVLPKFGEVLKRVRPFENFLRSDERLNFNEKIVLDGDSAGDGFDFSLEVRDLGDEDLTHGAGFWAQFSDLLGEHVKLNFQGINLLLVVKILLGDLLVGVSNWWGEFLLGDRE